MYTINLLKKMSIDRKGESHVTEDLFDVLIEALAERCRLRSSWKERYRDPIFATIAEDERPFSCPCLDREKDNIDTRSENLDGLVSQLRQWRSAFISASSNEGDDTNSESPSDAKKSKKMSKRIRNPRLPLFRAPLRYSASRSCCLLPQPLEKPTLLGKSCNVS